MRRSSWLPQVVGVICTTVTTAGVPSGATPAGTVASAPTMVAGRTVVPLVFENVTVIDVLDGTRLPAQRVVIIGNRIQTIGSMQTVPMPAGGRVIDARGKFLIPGLWDMHTHSERSTDFFYPLFIVNGVTGIRDAWSVVPLDTLRLWRGEIVAGTRIGPPRQLLAGPALDEATPCPRRGTGHICVADSADARHVVDSLKAAGADFIKTYKLGRQMYFVIAAEARRMGIPFGGHVGNPIWWLGLPGDLWPDLWHRGSALAASDSGASILDHVDDAGDLRAYCMGTHVQACQRLAERFRHNGTWWVPTLITLSHGTHEGITVNDGPIALQSPSQHIVATFNAVDHAFWTGAVVPRNWLGTPDHQLPPPPAQGVVSHTSIASGGSLSLAHRAGMPILAGTDVIVSVDTDKSSGKISDQRMVPGFSLHAELALLVGEGLTPLEALQAATINPAKYLHGTDSLGTVAPGKLADLVVLDADPLIDITNTTAIHAVVANGRYFDRAALDQLLTENTLRAKKELP